STAARLGRESRTGRLCSLSLEPSIISAPLRCAWPPAIDRRTASTGAVPAWRPAIGLMNRPFILPSGFRAEFPRRFGPGRLGMSSLSALAPVLEGGPVEPRRTAGFVGDVVPMAAGNSLAEVD